VCMCVCFRFSLSDLYEQKGILKHVQIADVKVTLMTHRATERDVVVKRLPYKTEADRRRADQQVRILHTCRSNPTIVTTLATHREHDDQDDHLWIVSEYCGYLSVGWLLLRLPDGGRMTEAEVQHVAASVLEALCDLHRHEVVHRGVTYHNILMDLGGHVKLGGFGSAKLLGGPEDRCATPNPVQGMSRAMCLMAPEMLDLSAWPFTAVLRSQRPHSYTKSVDIWAVGTVCIVLAEGRLPFMAFSQQGDITAQRIRRAAACLQQSPGSEGLTLQGFSDEFRDFLDKCMCVEPAGRPSADELRGHPFVKDVDTREGNPVIHRIAPPTDIDFVSQSDPRHGYVVPHSAQRLLDKLVAAGGADPIMWELVNVIDMSPGRDEQLPRCLQVFEKGEHTTADLDRIREFDARGGHPDAVVIAVAYDDDDQSAEEAATNMVAQIQAVGLTKSRIVSVGKRELADVVMRVGRAVPREQPQMSFGSVQ